MLRKNKEKDGSKDKAAAKEKKKSSKEKAKDQVQELQDQLLRLRADFDNFRKRQLQEREDARRGAREDLIYEILPVLDHIKLGLEAAEAHDADEAFVQGYRMLSDQLTGALKKAGLAPIASEGQEFDPNIHEALSHLPSDEHAEGIVISEVRCGYMLGDRLLRAAQAVVSSGPAETTDPEETNEEKEA